MTTTDRRESLCDHKYPFCQRVGDIVLSRKPNADGLVKVDRYCDCLFCGPFVVELLIVPIYKDGELVRHDFPKLTDV